MLYVLLHHNPLSIFCVDNVNKQQREELDSIQNRSIFWFLLSAMYGAVLTNLILISPFRCPTTLHSCQWHVPLASPFAIARLIIITDTEKANKISPVIQAICKHRCLEWNDHTLLLLPLPGLSFLFGDTGRQCNTSMYSLGPWTVLASTIKC